MKKTIWLKLLFIFVAIVLMLHPADADSYKASIQQLKPLGAAYHKTCTTDQRDCAILMTAIMPDGKARGMIVHFVFLQQAAYLKFQIDGEQPIGWRYEKFFKIPIKTDGINRMDMTLYRPHMDVIDNDDNFEQSLVRKSREVIGTFVVFILPSASR